MNAEHPQLRACRRLASRFEREYVELLAHDLAGLA
jgi:hypothetical protein